MIGIKSDFYAFVINNRLNRWLNQIHHLILMKIICKGVTPSDVSYPT